MEAVVVRRRRHDDLLSHTCNDIHYITQCIETLQYHANRQLVVNTFVEGMIIYMYPQPHLQMPLKSGPLYYIYIQGVSGPFYPKRLTIRTFVRRKRNNISLAPGGTVEMFIELRAKH